MSDYEPQTILEKLLLKYPEKSWDWREISRNPSLTLNFIEVHPEKPWDWGGISENINLTMDFIEAHPD